MNKLYDPISKPFIFYYNKTHEAKSSPQTPYHRHNAYEIYLFLRGSRRMCIEDSCYICRPGDMFLISPEQLHAGLCDEDCEYERIIINVKAEYLEQLSLNGIDLTECFKFESMNQVKRIHLEYHERSMVTSLYEALEKSRKEPDFAQGLLNKTYILQLFIYINRWFKRSEIMTTSDNIMPEIISDVMAYIQDNLSNELTIENISKEFFFQSRYLSKMFKKYTGLTIRTYIMDRRIAMAKKLLCEGHNVSEACYRSGFNDYANFLRSFKNYVGMSPGKYAKSERYLSQK